MIGTFGLNGCSLTTKCISEFIDFYIIDREHGNHSFSEINNLFDSMDKTCMKFVRASECSRVEVQKCLELNPDGILIPQISSIEDAYKAVQYSFFPPKGIRGLSPYTKPFSFNHEGLDQKKIDINNKLKLGLLIEGKSGFESLEEIIRNFGEDIDLIYFGLFDFSSSNNLKPDWQSSELSSTLNEVIELSKTKNINVGTIALTLEDIAKLNQIGVEYIVYQNDLGIINEAFKSIK